MSVIRKIGRKFKELICSALGISTETKQPDKRIFEPGKTPEPVTKQKIPKPLKPEKPCKRPPKELKKPKDNLLNEYLEGHELDPAFIILNSEFEVLTDINKSVPEEDVNDYFDKDPITAQVVKSLTNNTNRSFVSEEFMKWFDRDQDPNKTYSGVKDYTKVPRFKNLKIPGSNVTYNVNYGTELDPKFLTNFHESRVVSKTNLDKRVPWNYWFATNKGILVGFNMFEESHVKFRKKFSTYLRTKSKDKLIEFLDKYKVDYWDMKAGRSFNNNLKKLTNPLLVLPGLDLDSSFITYMTPEMYNVFSKQFNWNYKYVGTEDKISSIFEDSNINRNPFLDRDEFSDNMRQFYQLNALLLKIIESILRKEPRTDVYVPSEVKKMWRDRFGTNLDRILDNTFDKDEMLDIIEKIKENFDYEVELDEIDLKNLETGKDKIVYSFEGPLSNAIDLYENLKSYMVFNPITNSMEPFLPPEYIAAYEETISILKEFHRTHGSEEERVTHQQKMRENEILNLYHRVFPLFRYPDQDKIAKKHLNEKVNRNRKKE